jgi:prepilin-type processing-associated H-X9-DG protein
MASKTGFKQQCPHCEAIVPIKDEELIGKRIRCPKCNEPFRVEDLEGVAATTKTAKPAKGDAAATKKKAGAKRTADDDDEQPKFKKKKGDSNKLLIGLGLAGVAVVLLVVTVIIVMNNNPTKTTSSPSSPAASRTSTPEPERSTTPEENPAAAIALASTSNITNMLPNETQVVINLPMPAIRDNPLGQKMFRDNLGASSRDAGRMGFTLNDVDRWIMALGLGDPVWYFHIIRTTKPVNLDVLKKTLQLKPAAGGPIQGQDYFVTPVNWADSAKMLPTYLKPTGEAGAAGSDSHPLCVRLHDPFTLVIADQFPMKKFLEVKGNFKEQAPLAADQAQNNSPFGNFPGGSPFGNPGGRGPRGGAGAPPVGPGTPPGGGGPGAASPPPPSVGNYRTINPRLKRMLDRVETNTPYLCSMGMDLEGDEYFSFLASIFLGFKGSFHTAGFSFQWKSDNKMVAVASLECDSDQAATSLRQGIDKFLQPYFSLPANPVFQLKRGRERPENPQGGGPSPGRPGPGIPGGPPNRPGFPPGGDSNPRNPNQPNQPNRPQEPPPAILIHLDVTAQGAWVNVASDINVRDEVRTRLLRWIEPYLVRMQGEFEMAMAQPNPYQLSAAARSVAEKDLEFPRGTEDRQPSASRAGRAWPADQRVSWMADLLPYLGYEHVANRINRKQSWRDEDNLIPASVLVPNFLAPGTLKSTWYVSYPGIEPELAATHFVGMAGVGLDAASYPPDHPDAGIFNYYRRTPLARVTDKARTILMIQVPPGYHSPWIAGGGSTIRGVPETKSIQPFLSLNEDRQRGTNVLMADGSVRWISEKVSDDVFKAMCRVKGDKSSANLSQFRPLPVPEEAELKATPKVPSAAAPTAEEKKPAPPAATKPAPAAPAPKAGTPPAAAAPKAGAPPVSK